MCANICHVFPSQISVLSYNVRVQKKHLSLKGIAGVSIFSWIEILIKLCIQCTNGLCLNWVKIKTFGYRYQLNFRMYIMLFCLVIDSIKLNQHSKCHVYMFVYTYIIMYIENSANI